MKKTLASLALPACLLFASSAVRAQWASQGAGLPVKPSAGASSASAAAKPLPKEIILYVYGGNDPSFEFSSRMNASADATPNLVHLKVSGGTELIGRLREIQAAGSRITKLVIDAHGAPGLTEAMDSSDLPRFKGLDAVFAPGTDIIFHSCSVAVGEEGRRFLKNVGTTLLTKGGTVTAAEGTFYFYGDKVSRALMPDFEGYSPKGWVRYTAVAGGGGSFQYIPVGVEEVGEKGDARLRQAEALAQLHARVERTMQGAALLGGSRAVEFKVGADAWLADKGVGAAGAVARSQLDFQHALVRAGAKAFLPRAVPAIDQAHAAAVGELKAQTAGLQRSIDAGAALARKGISAAESKAQAALDEAARLKEAGIRAAGTFARETWKAEVEGAATLYNASRQAASEAKEAVAKRLRSLWNRL